MLLADGLQADVQIDPKIVPTITRTSISGPLWWSADLELSHHSIQKCEVRSMEDQFADVRTSFTDSCI